MRGRGSPLRLVNPGGKTHRAPSLSTSSPAASRSSTTAGQHRVVEALAHHVVVGEQDAELGVDLVEVADALGHQDPPQAQGLGLSPDCRSTTRPAAALAEGLVGVEGGPGLAVETVEVADRQLVGRLLLAQVDEMLDEHPERGAPVADVVLAAARRVRRRSSSRHRASPMTVPRRWPTCISLATLGAE